MGNVVGDLLPLAIGVAISPSWVKLILSGAAAVGAVLIFTVIAASTIGHDITERALVSMTNPMMYCPADTALIGPVST